MDKNIYIWNNNSNYISIYKLGILLYIDMDLVS